MYEKLIVKALEARNKAYAPYSSFRVGAALLSNSQKIYTGCNIENASFGATCCAERVAIYKAVSEGERDFQSIAILSDFEDFTFPCGICRQVMIEFNVPKVIVVNNQRRYKEYTIEELMPDAFNPSSLN